MSIRSRIESVMPKRRRRPRTAKYAVTIGHPLETEALTSQDAENTTMGWFATVHSVLLDMGLRPRGLTTGIRPGAIETICTLRLSNDEAALQLMEALWGRSCEHTFVSVVPVDKGL